MEMQQMTEQIPERLLAAQEKIKPDKNTHMRGIFLTFTWQE
jgi:hypothetical protein